MVGSYKVNDDHFLVIKSDDHRMDEGVPQSLFALALYPPLQLLASNLLLGRVVELIEEAYLGWRS